MMTPRPQIPTEVWVLLVRRADIPYLNRSLAGLNLFERHIREAKHWNIRQVIFWLEPPQMLHDQGLRIEYDRLIRRLKTRFEHSFVRSISSIRELNVHEAERAMAAPHLSLFTHQWMARWSLALEDHFHQNSSFDDVWAEIKALPEVDEWKEEENPTVFYIPLGQERDWSWAQRRLGVEIVEQTRAGIVGKNFNRKISLFLSRFFVTLDLSPMTWTWVNVLFGLGAAVCMMQPSYGWRMFAALLFYWSCIFDGVDGEIARFRFELSEKGALLDMAASWFNTLLFYGALIFSLVAQGELAPHQGQFILGGCALLLVALSAYFIQIVKVPLGQGAWGEWERRYQSSLRVPYISALFRKESFAILSVILIIVGATAWVPWGMLAFFSLALAVIVDVELKHRRVVTESVEVTSE